ncbi:MAG: hypothetical protein MUE81_10450 [Thermoflexibacter sp.]|jgi:hypothetical protein|nr:hypothetical protein [Thermoflexibacter sp.]
MKVLISLLIIFIPFLAFANGGPIDESHFRKTGNIRLLRTADVSLLKENLHIKVVGDFTEIEVEYHLKNNGKKQKVQYGFPVDAYETDWYPTQMGTRVFEKEKDFVKYFKIIEHDRELKITHWVLDSVYTAKSVQLFSRYPDNKKYTILRKWYATTIDFEQDEMKVIKVIYKVKNTLQDKDVGLRFTYFYSDRHFTYHLTPSSSWGDGKVGEFNLKIDVSDIALVSADFTVKGIEGLSNTNNIFSYYSKDYDLQKSDRIDIHYNYNHVRISPFIKKYDITNFVKSIKSSSNNETVQHLIDKSHQTSWTGSEGDWIEITLNELQNDKYHILIGCLLILNGDYASKEAFDKSGKIKKIGIVVNDTLIYDKDYWKNEKKNHVMTVETPVFKNLTDELMCGLANIVIDERHQFGLPDKIYKIKIKFLKTNKEAGEKFTLSELYLLGR